jgi:hypothetical protein
MAQLKVSEKGLTASIILYPYDKLAFARFCHIFTNTHDPKSVDPSSWFAVHFLLSNVVRYCADEGQVTCFNKFAQSMGKWNLYSFSTALYKEDRNLPNEALARFRKVKSLILNNSVLFQHFGIYDINQNEALCDYVVAGAHKICTSHIVQNQECDKQLRYYNGETFYTLNAEEHDIKVVVLKPTKYEKFSGGGTVVDYLKVYLNLPCVREV